MGEVTIKAWVDRMECVLVEWILDSLRSFGSDNLDRLHLDDFIGRCFVVSPIPVR